MIRHRCRVAKSILSAAVAAQTPRSASTARCHTPVCHGSRTVFAGYGISRPPKGLLVRPGRTIRDNFVQLRLRRLTQIRHFPNQHVQSSR
jgi:hypothetical protein